jgi:hypothetical protein
MKLRVKVPDTNSVRNPDTYPYYVNRHVKLNLVQWQHLAYQVMGPATPGLSNSQSFKAATANKVHNVVAFTTGAYSLSH